MPRHENPEVVGAVMALDHVGFSRQQISNILKERNVSMTKMGVHRLIARKKLDASGKKKTVTRLTNPGTPKVRKRALIAKVKKAVTGKNPKTQRTVARNLKVSVSTVNRVIHQDLHGILRKKYRVHALSNKQIKQRLERGPLFLQYLVREGFKKIISVDEAWVYLSNVGGLRRVYYEFKGEKSEESWQKFWQVRHPVGVMFFAGVSYWGKTKLRFVEPKAKINANYYIDNLLSPLFQHDIPEMFKGRKYLPVFHHDNAPAHAAKKTQEWLRNSGIKFIPKEHWMGNAPDCAIMDFFVNGMFKWELFDRQPTTLEGLKKVMTSVWDNLDQAVIQKAFRGWSKRIEMMTKGGGHHIEVDLTNL